MADINETKKIIRSILTSSPREMTVSQLNKDFKDIEGRYIPYLQLGYETLEEFIHRIPDTVKLKGTGLSAIAIPVVGQNSLASEINRLVKLQKVVPKKTRYGKQYTRLRSFVTENHKPSCNDKKETCQTPNKEDTKNAVKQLPPSLGAIRKEIIPEICYNFEGEDTTDDLNEIYTSDDNDSYESNNVPVYRIPFEIQENLRKLIKKTHEGIWCAKLPTIYKTEFGSELNYLKYGYKSLAHMCADLPHILQCIQPGSGDYKIFDKNKAIPKEEFNVQKQNCVPKSTPEKCSEALPYVDDLVEKMLQAYYPPDIVKPCEELEKQWIYDDIKIRDFLDIFISEIYDPSKFWIILANEQCYGRMNNMMNEMQVFYTNHASEFSIKNNKLIKLGLYCAALYNNEYTRAIIVKALEDKPGFVKVFYIDFGTVETVPIHDVFFLHRMFFQLPAQAIRARLAGILPPKTNMPWSMKCTEIFFKLTNNKKLVGQLMHKNDENNILELFICDTTTENDIYIIDCLVDSGEAIYSHQEQETFKPQCSPIVKYIHLYPTFDELERALSPSALDVNLFLSRGIEHFSILPKYYYNPTYQENWTLQIDKMKLKDNDENQCSLSMEATIENDSKDDDQFFSNFGQLSIDSDRLSTSTLKDSSASSECSLPNQANEIRSEQTFSPSLASTSNKPALIRPPPGFHFHPSQTNSNQEVHISESNFGAYQNNYMYYNQEAYEKLLQAQIMKNALSATYYNCFPTLPINVNPVFLNHLYSPMNHLYNQYVLNNSLMSQNFIPNYLNGNLVGTITAPFDPNHFYNNSVSNTYKSLMPESYETQDATFTNERTKPEIKPKMLSTINTEINSTTDSEDTEIYTKTYSSSVSQQELSGKIIHIIRFHDGHYAIVNEIVKKFIGLELPIIQIRKSLTLKCSSLTILDVNLKDNPLLKQQLCRLQVIKYTVDFLHVIPATKIQLFLDILGVNSVVSADFEKLIKYGNS